MRCFVFVSCNSAPHEICSNEEPTLVIHSHSDVFSPAERNANSFPDHQEVFAVSEPCTVINSGGSGRPDVACLAHQNQLLRN
ncbi:hypothetical protein E2C01_031147 [Portunus trituberculatus]|uniref:Uncharacterized protein n=1 Tax=Portunus trituberculatus TaxID=210409 RepID=A0A5B7ES98_PORTR|nr:hypothetical protein [Portunus trituberculatus]